MRKLLTLSRAFVVFGTLLLLVAGLALPAQAAVTVTITPVNGTSVPQGVPWEFTADLDNTGATEETVTVGFRLTRLAGGAPVSFLRVTETVPAGGTVTVSGSATTAQWFAQKGSYQVAPYFAGNVLAGSPVSFSVTNAPAVVPRFSNVTASTGLTTTIGGYSCQSTEWAQGAAWGDVDGDGDLDLYLTDRAGLGRLWINDGTNHFTDQAAARGVDNAGREAVSAVFADYDNDGDQDLYVGNLGGSTSPAANRLYLNDGTGHFTDVAAAAGVEDANGNSVAIAWGDYDSDGLLDLYVTDYSDDCDILAHQADKLYHNEGNGTFSDVSSFISPTIGDAWQAGWIDYDNDGDQDLYLANDHVPPTDPPTPNNTNRLFRNDGPGPGNTWVFTDVSAASLTDYAMNSMGLAFGDYNRDGYLDIGISNMVVGQKLAKNNGDGTFTDVAVQQHVARPTYTADQVSITWGMGFFDFNNDGLEDLYVAGGEMPGFPGAQPNQLYVSTGGAYQFLDLSAPSKANDFGTSRGIAFADLNHDGKVDFYVVNQNGTPNLFKNVTSTTNHWLEVNPVGTTSNRDGCGARVTVVSGGITMIRDIYCGSISDASGSETIAHFGLGSSTSITSLTIDWPSGIHQVISPPSVDQLLTVTEA